MSAPLDCPSASPEPTGAVFFSLPQTVPFPLPARGGPALPPALRRHLGAPAGPQLSEPLGCWLSSLPPGGCRLHSPVAMLQSARRLREGRLDTFLLPGPLACLCGRVQAMPFDPLALEARRLGPGSRETGTARLEQPCVLGQLPPPGPCSNPRLAEKELVGWPGARAWGELRLGTQSWSQSSASLHLACMAQAGAYTRPGAPVLQLLPGHTAWLWWPVGVMPPGLTGLPPRERVLKWLPPLGTARGNRARERKAC